MKIFIPSINRPVALPAARYFHGAGLPVAVVVPESQFSAYQAANPGIDLVAIPDAQDGNSARKRNVILDMIRAESDQTGFMVDDDVNRLVRCREPGEANDLLSGKSAQEVYDLEHVPATEAVQGMQDLSARARAEGAVYFGFNNSRSYLEYKSAEPYSTTSFFCAVAGFVAQAEMHFDESLVRGATIDFFLQHQGKVLRDNRYAPDRVRMAGGIGVSARERRADYQSLVAKWGAEVIELAPAGYGVVHLKPEAVVP